MTRAVAYIRVSSKSTQQQHSYEYQLEYWENYLKNKADIEFCGLYADHGISGKSMTRRTGMNKMIEQAKKKEFDVIYTKSVARFARNAEDLLNTVRQLREIGVKVFFEKENIDTMDPSAELYLTIAAAVAENELRVYSENQQWSIRERFKNGFISIGSKIYGYKMNPTNNTLEIYEEEAKVVRYIYKQYLSGCGLWNIVKDLMQKGIKNTVGEERWHRYTVDYILSNEKYKGCVLSQKTINNNGNQKMNNGEVRQYYMEDTHPAIISKEDFEAVQEEKKRRTTKGEIKERVSRYAFTGLIKCGHCGESYSHKIQNSNKKWRSEIWLCNHKRLHGKDSCQSERIKDDVLREKFIEAYNEYIEQGNYNIANEEVAVSLEEELKKERELKQLKVNYMISHEEYLKRMNIVMGNIEKLKAKTLEYSIKNIRGSDYTKITEFDEDKVDKFIDKIIMHKGMVTFRFINGREITKVYNNGKAGNQKGWRDK